jgi:hypothetical protein
VCQGRISGSNRHAAQDEQPMHNPIPAIGNVPQSTTLRITFTLIIACFTQLDNV